MTGNLHLGFKWEMVSELMWKWTAPQEKLCTARKTWKVVVVSHCNILLMQSGFTTIQRTNKSLIGLFKRKSKQFCYKASPRLTELTHGFTLYWQTWQHHIYLSWRQKQFKDLLMFWDGGETFPCSLILSQQEQRKLRYKGKLSIFDMSHNQQE